MKQQDKEQVIQRADGRCEYCRALRKYSAQPFCIDHISPRSKGGKNELDNYAFCCGGCNAHKYNHTTGRDPLSNLEVPLFHPRQQRWTDHFTWDETRIQVVGITPCGRATVRQLQLNRSGVQQLRMITMLTGEHPPSS